MQMEFVSIDAVSEGLESSALTVMWFRQDLRLRDNPALAAAAADGVVLPVYILDDDNAGKWKMGGASRWWLHHSLARLNDSLDGKLWVLRGDAERELLRLCAALPVRKVVWNRCYEPWRMRRDRRVKAALGKAGIAAESFHGSLLREPWQSVKDDGSAYDVFTPFYRKLLATIEPEQPMPAPRNLALARCSQSAARTGDPAQRSQSAAGIDALELKPRIPWDAGLEQRWQPGEESAQARLREFLAGGVADYRRLRDFPAVDAVSSLSPHLHFGEISPRQIWWDAQGGETEAFTRQLCWRDFCYHWMFHYPAATESNWRGAFDEFPWRDEPDILRRWQQGATGIPLVDAGMRELWRTGTMHNRVRMVTASFLTKNLLLHWLRGAEWFWDCLVDADLANNSFGWQWVAGSGADAAPYFRIFNPVLQSRKFDPEGEYLRRWLPELARLSNRHLHAPWEAGAADLRAAGVSLGENYPAPIADLGETRKRALAAWETMRQVKA